MTKIVTKSELREKYGVTQEDIDKYKYNLGECRMLLEQHADAFSDYDKREREARKMLAMANRSLKVVTGLQSPDFYFAGELEELVEPDYGVFPGLTPTLTDWKERLEQDIEFWSHTIEQCGTLRSNHNDIQTARDTYIERLKQVGEYNA